MRSYSAQVATSRPRALHTMNMLMTPESLFPTPFPLVSLDPYVELLLGFLTVNFRLNMATRDSWFCTCPVHLPLSQLPHVSKQHHHLLDCLVKILGITLHLSLYFIPHLPSTSRSCSWTMSKVDHLTSPLLQLNQATVTAPNQSLCSPHSHSSYSCQRVLFNE